MRPAGSAVSLLIVTVLAGCGGSGGSNKPAGVTDPAQLVLRLTDLPDGYRVGDDSGCGPLDVEGASPSLAHVALAYRPNGCTMQFERVYRTTPAGEDPPLVESVAFVFDTSEEAQVGFGAGDALVRYVTGEDELREAGASGELGEQTRWFATRDALVAGHPGHPGFAVLWRSGRVVATVFVAGISGPTGERATLSLGKKQLATIQSPSPVTRSEQNDREVALDNPRLGVDVYWLGREFSPGNGLPDIRLSDTSGPLRLGESPGNVVKIDYTRGVNVDIWERPTWDRFLHTKLGRLVWDSPCARSRTLTLPRGRAVIFGGYAPDVPLPSPVVAGRHHTHPTGAPGSVPQVLPCPDRPPDRFLAHVYLGNEVVSANLPYCFSCAPRPKGDLYNSWHGMEAIAQGLRLRPTAGK